MEKRKKYSIGLDIGNTSVGWAVIDNDNFKVLKKGNKHQSLWGVRLFNEANSAIDRRTYRSTRRRYDRRRERIKLLQNIFFQEINKVDPLFFKKMSSSFYNPEDTSNKKILLTEDDKKYIFNNNKRKVLEKEYPTIYHLRNKLINSQEKADIRQIYLAIHHIIKYRGNFLYENKEFNINDLNIQNKLKEVFENINIDCPEIEFNIEHLDNSFYEKLEASFSYQTLNDRKELIKDTLKLFFNKDFINEFIKLIIGNQFSISKIFNIELDEDLKLNFRGTDFEEKYSELEKILNDKITTLTLLKELYDMLFLKKILGNNIETNISSIMIKKYQKHHNDLILLKKILKKNKPLYYRFFKNTKKEQCIYQKYINNQLSYEEFIKEINNYLKKDNSLIKEYPSLIKDIENEEFMPKITSNENGKYPYQLNKNELIKIIENQGKYDEYKFLLDKVVVEGIEQYKLVCLLEFKIPYYVGPLNKNTDKATISNKNAWLIKNNEHIKITPYNFNEVINKEATAEKFITRMISNCTYLINEKAIPANSILYSKYKVLNELKQIKINDKKIPIKLQQQIYKELFLKSNNTITEKNLIDYLKVSNEYNMYDDIIIKGFSDNKKFANNMKSYYDFFGNDGIFENTDYTIDDAEEIIKWITIFEDKDILLKKITNKFSKLNSYQIKKITTIKYKGWSSLSEKLLTGIYVKDNNTQTSKSIMDLLWETNLNFMQILFNKEYNFQKIIDDMNMVTNTNKINYSLVENLATSPATKRGIYQALKVVEEIISYMGYNPDSISIEMARNEGKKERKIDRKNYLKLIYEKNKSDINNYNSLIKELNQNDKIDSEKLFLYFIQLGKSMYSNTTLDINNLPSYEVDHIIPRSLIKDDSIENKVLVLKKENQLKAKSLVVPDIYRTKDMINWWNYLNKMKLISDKKLHNLCRAYYSDGDIEGFINRQLVETRQITKHVANILKSYYKDTNIIYLHADLTSNYRNKFELYKYRDLNDYHHAHDAYLASVLGIYKEKYLKTCIDFNKLKQMTTELKPKDLKYGYVINSINNEFANFNEDTGEILFDAEKFNETIKTTLYQNDILISKKTEFYTDRFFKETIYKKDDVKAKFNLKKNLSTKYYGGYNETNYSYMMLIEYNKKNKIEKTLIGIPLLLEKNKNKKELIDKYIKDNLKTDKYIIKKDKIPFNSIIIYKNQLCAITGCGIGSAEIINAKEFRLNKEIQEKYKYLLNFIFNNKYPVNDNISHYEIQDKYNKIFGKEIDEFYNLVLEIIKKEYPIYESIYEKLKKVKESGEFYNLPLLINDEKNNKEEISKVFIIKEIFKLLKFNSSNANLEKLNKTIKFTSRVGRISGVNIKSATIINKSVTGIKEQKYEF